ncbi:hypothetical protein HD806DRAFT_247232 [Xylariaceae sp. AK1471]|nr:hypothetical protein HD806DRAFT_247232 [Xylariaceae sp. AK1471]
MDPLSTVAIVSSLVTFSQTTLLLIQNIARSEKQILSLNDEIIILQSILNDSKAIVESEASVPNTVQRSLGLCHQKQIHLLESLEKFMPMTRDSRFRKIFKLYMLVVEEPRITAAYRSFRDSVLMLRDLTADMRMYQQMINISSTMALLLAEGGLSSGIIESRIDHHESLSGGQTTTTTKRPGSVTGERRKGNDFYMDFVSLMHFDFTRDLILIIEVAAREGPDRFEFVPLRNKIDTASDENFVSRKVLEKHNMDMSKLIQIPEEDRRERTLECLGGHFTPEQEVALRWHKLQDRKQREGLFIVIDDPPFDLLIGSKQFANESRPSVMFGFGRYVSKARRKDQDQEHEERKRDADNEIRAQLVEARKLETLLAKQ